MPFCQNSSNLSAIAAKAFSPVLIVLRRKEFVDCADPAEEEKNLREKVPKTLEQVTVNKYVEVRKKRSPK